MKANQDAHTETDSPIIQHLRDHYIENPPDDVVLEKLKLQAYALLYLESPRAAANLWRHYSKPVEDVEIEKIRLKALCLRELDKERPKKTFIPKPELEVTNLSGEKTQETRPKRVYTTVHSDVIETDLFGKELPRRERRKLVKTMENVEYAAMQSGIITMFEKAECYGNPVDAINYWLNKRGRRTAFGNFVGFVYGAYPVPCPVRAMRVMFRFTVKEPHIEARKAHRRNLKRIGVKRHQFRNWWKGNTLTDFATGKAEEMIWRKNNPDEWEGIRIERVKERIDRRKERAAREG